MALTQPFTATAAHVRALCLLVIEVPVLTSHTPALSKTVPTDLALFESNLVMLKAGLTIAADACVSSPGHQVQLPCLQASNSGC